MANQTYQVNQIYGQLTNLEGGMAIPEHGQFRVRCMYKDNQLLFDLQEGQSEYRWKLVQIWDFKGGGSKESLETSSNLGDKVMRMIEGLAKL